MAWAWQAFGMRCIKVENRSFVSRITLNRPERLNAVDFSMLVELRDALAAAYADTTIRSVLLTGAGRAFCAGGVLTEGDKPDLEEVHTTLRDAVTPIIDGLLSARKPIVAAVNGPAAGFGMSLALAADIAIAAHSARFALSFVKIGAALDGGASFLVTRSIGAARARALALLGEVIDGRQAAEWGLVWRAVPDEALESEAATLAERLATGPASAIATIKAQLSRAADTTARAALECEEGLQRLALGTPDALEGVTAFRERREPRFNKS